MVERTEEMLCEMCEKRLATRTLPRGPRNEGHINVCEECETRLYRGGEHR